MSQQLSDRPRISAAILHTNGHDVLMVQHRRLNGTTYWQLPGGGVEADEHPESATLRELAEETGLTGRIVRQLFVLSYKYGLSTTYLVVVTDEASLRLGADPEERSAHHKKLVAVAWQPLDGMRGNPEIEALIQALATYPECEDGANA